MILVTFQVFLKNIMLKQMFIEINCDLVLFKFYNNWGMKELCENLYSLF